MKKKMMMMMRCLWMAAMASAFMGAPFAQPKPPGQSPDVLAEVAGDYQLHGVMETAAHLRLSNTGRFTWQLSVGNLDKVVQGDYVYDPPSLYLQADDAEDALARRIALVGVTPIPLDVPTALKPAITHPQAVAFKLMTREGGCVECNLLIARTSGEEQLETIEESVEHGEAARWSVGLLPAGQHVAGVVVISGEGDTVQREMELDVAPGHLVSVQINADGDDDGTPRILQMHLERLDDGSLVHVDSLFGNSNARYVRD
ncbi:MAG: hypothetical protein Q4G62_00560 [Pseudomonadota bacterium]|nr:hypothetical protein [Pseudomonadota bacterium]